MRSPNRPKAKLRGKARLSRQRRVYLTIFPHAKLEATREGAVAHILSAYQDGCYRIEQRSVYDGLGNRLSNDVTFEPAKPVGT